MKKQTLVSAVIVLVCIPLLPLIYNVITNVLSNLGRDKIDDWVYEGGSVFSLFGSWLQLDLTQKAIVLGILALFVAYICFPLYRFMQGLLATVDQANIDTSAIDASAQLRGHRLWCGAPAMLFIMVLYAFWIVFAFDLQSNFLKFFEGTAVIPLLTFGALVLIFLLLIARLFFGGLYSWIRNHGNDSVRRMGKSKFFFSFYYIVFLLVPITIMVLLASLNTARSSLGLSGGVTAMNLPSAPAGSLGNPMSDTIGLAVGGAKDVNNFRKNIENGYLPTPTDITHEGIFYDYTFDTGMQDACHELFCPSYTSAVSKDPFSSSTEYFLSVGLNSGIKQEDFKRKKLNLVLVMDISGSMSSSFNRYYYDQFRTDLKKTEEEIDTRSKMEIANESIVALLDHLQPDDKFGVVLFDNVAYSAKGLRTTGETDMDALKEHILDITPRGGTNMEAGYRAGTAEIQKFVGADQNEYENRIIFLTDAMPNIGQISEDKLFGLTKSNAEKNIYTTFIGVGVDFNTELVNEITKTQGANYYSIHSADEFKKRMDEGFDYMVTPLIFDLTLGLQADGYEIRSVYGSPEADMATGELMKVNTLFPSERTDNETRGGLVLLQLKKISENASIKLNVQYKDRVGKIYNNAQEVTFSESDGEYFSHSGIHKGVVLSRYVNVMKDWILHETGLAPKPVIEIPIVRYTAEGIPITETITKLGRWERTSNQLTLSPEYYSILVPFRNYMQSEISNIGDDTLLQEIGILDKIISRSSQSQNPQ
jgi:Ca-activated chloride channel homolog